MSNNNNNNNNNENLNPTLWFGISEIHGRSSKCALIIPYEYVGDDVVWPMYIHRYGFYLRFRNMARIRYLKRKGYLHLLPEEYRYRNIGILR